MRWVLNYLGQPNGNEPVSAGYFKRCFLQCRCRNAGGGDAVRGNYRKRHYGERDGGEALRHPDAGVRGAAEDAGASLQDPRGGGQLPPGGLAGDDQQRLRGERIAIPGRGGDALRGQRAACGDGGSPDRERGVLAAHGGGRWIGRAGYAMRGLRARDRRGDTGRCLRNRTELRDDAGHRDPGGCPGGRGDGLYRAPGGEVHDRQGFHLCGSAVCGLRNGGADGRQLSADPAQHLAGRVRVPVHEQRD